MRFINRTLMAVLAWAAASTVVADPVNKVDPASLTVADTITFSEAHSVGGGVIGFDGVDFSEGFNGQSLEYVFIPDPLLPGGPDRGPFDALHGVPGDPLTLQPGSEGDPFENVRVWIINSDDIILGYAPGNDANPGKEDGFGEGAVSMLFGSDQSEIGLDIGGIDARAGAAVTLQFFRRDGIPIGVVTIGLDELEPYRFTRGTWAFRREGGVADIAGVSIHHTDIGGLFYDNLRYAVISDSDGDGVPDDADACPASDLGVNVVIDGCDSGVANVLSADGCTTADLIGECAAGAANHGAFVSCVADLLNGLKQAGVITGKERGKAQSCAAKADIPL